MKEASEEMGKDPVPVKLRK